MIHRLGIKVGDRELLAEVPDNLSDHVQRAEVEEIKARLKALIELEHRRWWSGRHS